MTVIFSGQFTLENWFRRGRDPQPVPVDAQGAEQAQPPRGAERAFEPSDDDYVNVTKAGDGALVELLPLCTSSEASRVPRLFALGVDPPEINAVPLTVASIGGQFESFAFALYNPGKALALAGAPGRVADGKHPLDQRRLLTNVLALLGVSRRWVNFAGHMQEARPLAVEAGVVVHRLEHWCQLRLVEISGEDPFVDLALPEDALGSSIRLFAIGLQLSEFARYHADELQRILPSAEAVRPLPGSIQAERAHTEEHDARGPTIGVDYSDRSKEGRDRRLKHLESRGLRGKALEMAKGALECLEKIEGDEVLAADLENAAVAPSTVRSGVRRIEGAIISGTGKKTRMRWSKVVRWAVETWIPRPGRGRKR
ncbi:MAG: hypothetical protein R3F49_20655 [Planctomycetota bacterium]